jgi:hypothetical protein
MTAYLHDFFTPTPQLIPQFVLACIAQLEADIYFIANDKTSVDTRYAQDGVLINVNLDNFQWAYCKVDVKLPVIQKTGLLTKLSLAERIVPMTSVDIGRLSIPRQLAYAVNTGYLADSDPTYLTDDRDCLERRIAWLGLQITNLGSWIEDWNLYAYTCVAYSNYANPTGVHNPSEIVAKAIVSTYKNIFKNPFFLNSQLDDVSLITAYTDELISQLNSPIQFRAVYEGEFFSGYAGAVSAVEASLGGSDSTSPTDIVGTASERAFFDPASSQNRTAPNYAADVIPSQPSLNTVPDVTPTNTLPNC